MPFERGDVVVRRLDDRFWAVEQPLVYLGRTDRFTVPVGFRTDFASVPRVVVWLIPRFGRYTAAAILHDWSCSVGIATGQVTAREADGLFRRVMRESGVPVVRRWLMWAGVRWGALTDGERRGGWLAGAPGVVAISVLAAPVVVPPALLIAAALVVYGLVEGVVGLASSSAPRDAGSLRT